DHEEKKGGHVDVVGTAVDERDVVIVPQPAAELGGGDEPSASPTEHQDALPTGHQGDRQRSRRSRSCSRTSAGTLDAKPEVARKRSIIRWSERSRARSPASRRRLAL